MNQETTFSRREKWFVAILFTVALTIRLAYLTEIRSNPLFEHPRLDALFHDVWAQSIAAGNFRGDTVFFRAPFYPYLLGLLYKLFGHSYRIPRIVQHVLGAMTVVLVYLAARKLVGKPSAALASLLTCFYAVLIYFEGELLFESLLTFLCIAWILVTMRAIQRQTFVAWLFSGGVYGIICVTRPTFLVLILPLLAYIIYTLSKHDAKNIFTLVFAFFTGMAVCILPVAIRNVVVGNDVVLISSQGGINFYIGNNEYADGVTSAMPGALGASWENRDQSFYVEQALGHKPKPSEESSFWYEKGMEFVLDHPIQWAILTLKKAYLFWSKFEIPNNQSFYSFLQYSFLLRVLPIGFWLIGPLGLVGMFLLWKDPVCRVFVLFTLMYFFVTIAFFVCDRFRLPIIPLLCIFSAYAMTLFWQRIRMRELRWLAMKSPLIICAALLVNSDAYKIAHKTPAWDQLRLGIVANSQAQYEQAIKYFEECAALQPTMPNLHLNWGVSEWMLHNNVFAKREFWNELYRYPHSHGALTNLSQIYLEEGKIDSAILCGTQAINAKQYLPLGYIVTAEAYLRKKEIEKAESMLREGLRACGTDFVYGENMLARLEFSSGLVTEAEQRYRSILHRVNVETPVQPLYEPEQEYTEANTIGESKQTLKAQALFGLGRIFVSKGNIDSATQMFSSAVAVLPTYTDAWSNLGVAHMQLGKYEESLSAFQKAIVLDNGNYLTWYNVGILLGNAGRLGEAKKAFEKTLQLRPEFLPAKEKLLVTEKLMR